MSGDSRLPDATRRDSLGSKPPSSFYEKRRDPTASVHERNCSTDTSQLGDSLETSYRGRSQTISYPIKPQQRAVFYPGVPYVAGRGQTHRPAASPNKPSAPSPYGQYYQDMRENERDYPSATSQYRHAEEVAAAAAAAKGRQEMSSMFYPPHKLASLDRGSISAGLPRPSPNDQRERLIKESYILRDVMPGSREPTPNNKQRYDDAMERSRMPGKIPSSSMTSAEYQKRQQQQQQQSQHDNRLRSPTAQPYHTSRSEDSSDAPLDLSARSSPKSVGPVDPREMAAAAAALGPLAAYGYSEQALKAAQMGLSPAHISLYQHELMKQYRWPGGLALMNPEAMAAQMNAAAMWSSSLAAQDPRLTSPSERRVTSPADVKMLHNTSLSPRPPTVNDMSEKEREYHMSQQAASRHYAEHSPNRSVAAGRDRRQLLESHDTSRDYHQQGDYHHHGGARDAAMTHGDVVMERRAESRGHELKTAASLQQMHSPNVHQASPHHARQVAAATSGLLHSPHHLPRQPSPVNIKDRQATRSVVPNLLGDFPPEDVLFLRCNLCRDTYGNVHSFIKHFSRDHASEGDPRPHHVLIESISKAKHVMQSTTPHYPQHSQQQHHMHNQQQRSAMEPGQLMPDLRDRLENPAVIAASHMIDPRDPAAGRVDPRLLAQWETYQRYLESAGSVGGGVYSSPNRMSSVAMAAARESMPRSRGTDVMTSAAEAAAIAAAKEVAVKRSYAGAMPAAGVDMLQCDKCPQDFRTRDWGAYKRHVKSHETGGEKSRDVGMTSRVDERSGSGGLVCEECHANFLDKLEWQLHMSITHLNRKCVCSICNVSFDNIDGMYKHVEMAHSGFNAVEIEFKCLLCIQAFTNRHALKEHIKSKQCGIDINSVGSMIMLSVRKRVCHVAVSMSPPRRHCTPDTTCSEDKPMATETLPVTTIANTVTSPPDRSSNYKSVISSMVAPPDQQVSIIDIIKRTVEEEHRRQSGDNASLRQHFMPPDVTASKRVADVAAYTGYGEKLNDVAIRNSSLKRGLHDELHDSMASKHLKMDCNSVEQFRRHGDKVQVNAQSIISDIVESSLHEHHSDFSTMYKRSIRKLINDENERDQEHESGIVKQDADSSFENNTFSEHKKSLENDGKHHQNSIKKFDDDTKEFDKKIDSKDSVSLNHYDTIREEQTSAEDNERNMKINCDYKVPNYLNYAVKNHTSPNRIVTLSGDYYRQNDDRKTPDKKSSHSPESQPTLSPSAKSRDGMVAEVNTTQLHRSSSVSSQEEMKAKSKRQSPMPSEQSERGELSKQVSAKNREVTPDAEYNNVQENNTLKRVMSRVDSFEEGNLVICEDQTE